MIELLTAVRRASTLEEELERLSEEVWLVEMSVLSVLRAASTLDDDEEVESELVLMAASAASTLEDELLRLKLDV